MLPMLTRPQRAAILHAHQLVGTRCSCGVRFVLYPSQAEVTTAFAQHLLDVVIDARRILARTQLLAQARASVARTLAPQATASDGGQDDDGAAAFLPLPPALEAALTHQPGDPCPELLVIPGPQYQAHIIECRGAYGHADRAEHGIHVGRITARDRNDREVVATVTWVSK